MNAPPERKSPGAKANRGYDLRRAAGDRDLHSATGSQEQTAVSEPADILDTLPAFPLSEPEPRYEAGILTMTGDTPTGVCSQIYAFLRPYSGNSYELHPCANWWEATARAIELAQSTPDCEFIGGPPWGGDA